MMAMTTNSSPSDKPTTTLGFQLGTTNSAKLRSQTTQTRNAFSSSSSTSSNNNNNNGVILAKHIQEIRNKLDAKVKNVPWYGRAHQRVPNNQDGNSGGVTSANFLALELSPLFQRFAASRLSVSDESASTLKQQVAKHSSPPATSKNNEEMNQYDDSTTEVDHKYRGKARFSSYPVRPPSELHGTVRKMKWTIIISPTKPVK
jgi:hypothetical protein